MVDDRKKEPPGFVNLAEHDGQDWFSWLSAASSELPELQRALQCLSGLSQVLEQSAQYAGSFEGFAKDLTRLALKYIGASKCPSSSACEKMAFRVRVLHGWIDNLLSKHSSNQFVTHSIFLVGLSLLERLYLTCEGADDKYHVLTQAVRDLTKMWLKNLQDDELITETAKTSMLYRASMSDSIGVVAPQWWWSALKSANRDTLNFLIQQSIDAMQELQPSLSAGWKSYEGRWHRLRVRALLENLGESSLLAELLCRSAVDDFEAADAIRQMQSAGKNRQAISQGEKWLKNLAGSPVLAEALLGVYLEDGWDDEGIKLLASQYSLDPDPKWLELLKKNFGLDDFEKVETKSTG